MKLTNSEWEHGHIARVDSVFGFQNSCVGRCLGTLCGLSLFLELRTLRSQFIGKTFLDGLKEMNGRRRRLNRIQFYVWISANEFLKICSGRIFIFFEEMG